MANRKAKGWCILEGIEIDWMTTFSWDDVIVRFGDLVFSNMVLSFTFGFLSML